MSNHKTEELDTRIHSLRGPLNSIAMNAELAKLLVGSDRQTDDLVQALDTILRQCAACSRELDALRSYLTDPEGD
ncbi:MAG: histidine kinase [Halioglobus sp.]|nr:histidine kinase [Halioglobus sp.]